MEAGSGGFESSALRTIRRNSGRLRWNGTVPKRKRRLDAEVKAELSLPIAYISMEVYTQFSKQYSIFHFWCFTDNEGAEDGKWPGFLWHCDRMGHGYRGEYDGFLCLRVTSGVNMELQDAFQQITGYNSQKYA